MRADWVNADHLVGRQRDVEAARLIGREVDHAVERQRQRLHAAAVAEARRLELVGPRRVAAGADLDRVDTGAGHRGLGDVGRAGAEVLRRDHAAVGARDLQRAAEVGAGARHGDLEAGASRHRQLVAVDLAVVLHRIVLRPRQGDRVVVAAAGHWQHRHGDHFADAGAAAQHARAAVGAVARAGLQRDVHVGRHRQHRAGECRRGGEGRHRGHTLRAGRLPRLLAQRALQRRAGTTTGIAAGVAARRRAAAGVLADVARVLLARAVGRVADAAAHVGVVRAVGDRAEPLVAVPPRQVAHLRAQRKAAGRRRAGHHRAGALLHPRHGALVERPQRDHLAGGHRAAVAMQAGVDRDLDRHLLAGRHLQRRAVVRQHVFHRAVRLDQPARTAGAQALEQAGEGAHVGRHVDRRDRHLNRAADGVAGGVDQRAGRHHQRGALLAAERAAGSGVGQRQRVFARQHAHRHLQAAGATLQSHALELVSVAALAELQRHRRAGGNRDVGLAVAAGGGVGAGFEHRDAHALQRAGGIADQRHRRRRGRQRRRRTDRDVARGAGAAAAPIGHRERHREVAAAGEHVRELRAAAVAAVTEIPAERECVAVGVGRRTGIERQRLASAAAGRRREAGLRVGCWRPALPRCWRRRHRRKR